MHRLSHPGTIGFTGILLFTMLFNLQAQLSPSEAGYIDAVTDYGAVNDGVTLTTVQLQSAMDAAITEGKGLYLPPGEYLVDATLHIRPPSSDQKFVMQGATEFPTWTMMSGRGMLRITDLLKPWISG